LLADLQFNMQSWLYIFYLQKHPLQLLRMIMLITSYYTMELYMGST